MMEEERSDGGRMEATVQPLNAAPEREIGRERTIRRAIFDAETKSEKRLLDRGLDASVV